MQIILKLLPSMLEGLKTTLLIAGITWVLSIPLAFPVALLRLSKYKLLSIPAGMYINLMRATPLLLQLMFIYFGLPYLNIIFSREESVIIAFVLNYTAYFAEIFRGGIQSIDRGQYEAAKVLKISKINTFFKIILPQVIKITFPSINNETITLIKDTSLVYVLGVGELLRTGKIAANTMASLFPFVMVGAIYLIIISILTRILNNTEKKFQYYK